VAVDVPESLEAALKVVDPQLTAVGVVNVSKVNKGNTTEMVLVAYKGAFSRSINEIGVTP